MNAGLNYPQSKNVNSLENPGKFSRGNRKKKDALAYNRNE
jgi:hypothetical protein